jgi:hypothetical protein
MCNAGLLIPVFEQAVVIHPYTLLALIDMNVGRGDMGVKIASG